MVFEQAIAFATRKATSCASEYDQIMLGSGIGFGKHRWRNSGR